MVINVEVLPERTTSCGEQIFRHENFSSAFPSVRALAYYDLGQALCNHQGRYSRCAVDFALQPTNIYRPLSRDALGSETEWFTVPSIRTALSSINIINNSEQYK